MTPAWTSTGKDNVFHVTIPAKYRLDRPGRLRIAVVDRAGRSTQEGVVTFSAMKVAATGRPTVGLPPPARTPAVAVSPGTVQVAPQAPGGVQAPPPGRPTVTPVNIPVKLTPVPRLPEVPSDVAGRSQRLAARLPGPARPRYDLAKAEVLRAMRAPTADLRAAAQGAVRGQFPGATPPDIEALVAMVMLEASRSAEQDLRDAMAAMEQLNQAKQAQRDLAQRLQEQEDRLRTTTLKPPAAVPAPIFLKARPKGPRPMVHTPILNLELPKLAPDLIHPPAPRPEMTLAEAEAERARAKGNLDDLSEMGEMQQLQLQLAMERRAKVIELISNVMRKAAATEDSLVRNLK